MSETTFVLLSTSMTVAIAVGVGLVAARRRGQTIAPQRLVMPLAALAVFVVVIAVVISNLPISVATLVGVGALFAGLSVRIWPIRRGTQPELPKGALGMAVGVGIVAAVLTVLLAMATVR